MIEQRQQYINGKWVAPRHPNDVYVINPSTEEPFALISYASAADVDSAVAAARDAFDTWAQTSREERLSVLRAILQCYNEHAEDMAQAISMEMGAPIDLSRRSQVTSGSDHIEHFIEVLENFAFEKPLAKPGTDNMIIHEPIGVAALITPWNWPMNQVTLKVIPAIAAGCTCVLKPSEIAPMSSMVFAQIIDEAGVPAGVFNLINGDGAGVGTSLCTHRDIDMVSFTGSTRAGTAISKNAADTIKRVSLELGGKGANILFEDADDKAVKRGVRSCFSNSGQSCNAPTRLLAARAIYDKVLAEAKSVAEQTEVDVASKEGRHIGPVVSEVQFMKIQRLIEQGIAEGARVVCGGAGKPEAHPRGYFVKPTVFADVTPEMTIAREEVFGPVLSIIPFDTEEEAIAISNDTVYGLTNYIETRDIERARRVALKLRSGMVEINGQSLDVAAPFGGYRQSGNGREGGVWGLEEFLEVKAVSGWIPN